MPLIRSSQGLTAWSTGTFTRHNKHTDKACVHMKCLQELWRIHTSKTNYRWCLPSFLTLVKTDRWNLPEFRSSPLPGELRFFLLLSAELGFFFISCDALLITPWRLQAYTPTLHICLSTCQVPRWNCSFFSFCSLQLLPQLSAGES